MQGSIPWTPAKEQEMKEAKPCPECDKPIFPCKECGIWECELYNHHMHDDCPSEEAARRQLSREKRKAKKEKKCE